MYIHDIYIYIDYLIDVNTHHIHMKLMNEHNDSHETQHHPVKCNKMKTMIHMGCNEMKTMIHMSWDEMKTTIHMKLNIIPRNVMK